jgi:hypothetical protein
VILLPGLYLALLAFLLDRALRRWWEPVPARVWGVFALALLILFGPALFLGRVLLPADILPGVVQPEDVRKPPAGNPLQLDLVMQIVPLQASVRRALRAGEWPLWNDLVGAGMPLLADPQSQAFEPLVAAALPLPLPAAVGVTAGLRVLTALVFFFLLLRRQGLSEGSALFGSLAFGLGGFLMLWLSWPLANTPALLPLLLYALVVTADRGARRDFLLLVAALFSLLAGGHPETLLYAAGVGGLFALSRLLHRPPAERTGLVLRWALAGALAFGLAAPALVPAARFVPQSLRRQRVEIRNQHVAEDPAAFTGWETRRGRREQAEGLEKRVVSVFAPNAWGSSRYGDYWGDDNDNEDAAAFAGGAAMLAALLAFLPAARRFREERLFLALAPLSLLVAVHVPSLTRLLLRLPVFNQSLSANRRLLLVAGFSLAYLGACTVERWRQGEGPKRAAVVAGAAALLGLVAWGYLLSAEVEALRALRWFWMGLQLAVIAGGAGAVLLLASQRRRRWTPWVFCALAGLELLVFHQPANPSLPRGAFYPETPSLRFLQENAGGARIAGLANRLLPNSPSVYGLADIRISNPLKPFLYAQAVGAVSASVRGTEQILIEPEHPLYQLLGVRFLVAPPRMTSIAGLRQVFRDATARIYERTAMLPRLFLPAAVETAGAEAWPEWLGDNPDFAARALVAPAAGRPASWTAGRPRESALQILALRPAHLAARGHLAEERLLASSVYQDGGWRLLLDRHPFPTLVADGPFLAAWLPAGEHRLDVIYRAPGLLPGLALAAAALSALVVWLLRPAAKEQA